MSTTFLYFMGALTPTEIAQALSYRADAIKLFPAGDFGIEYCKSLMGPFSDIPLFAVGGIHFENVEEWMAIGIDGVGIGNALTRAVESEEDKTAHRAFVEKLVTKMKSVD